MVTSTDLDRLHQIEMDSIEALGSLMRLLQSKEGEWVRAIEDAGQTSAITNRILETIREIANYRFGLVMKPRIIYEDGTSKELKVGY